MEYLASGSADQTIKIWDLDEEKCKASLHLHTDKVQAVRWNSINESILLSGGYDKRINVIDVRERPLGNNAIKIKLPKEALEIESAQWHPTSEHNFAISTEAGIVLGYDSR